MFNVLATMVILMNRLVIVCIILLTHITGCSQEDTQTKSSNQKHHSAIESESTLISANEFYENEEI